MLCSMAELKEKDVINVCDGENLGYVDDVCMETHSRTIEALVLYGRPRFWGLFGTRETVQIPFEQVQLIGKDVILVAVPNESCTKITNKVRF